MTDCAQIIELKEKLAGEQTDLDDLTTKIAETRAKWQPRLETLASEINTRFSAAFDRPSHSIALFV